MTDNISDKKITKGVVEIAGNNYVVKAEPVKTTGRRFYPDAEDRKANAWVNHIKDWAKEKRMDFSCAVANPMCRKDYHGREKRGKIVETKRRALEKERMGMEDKDAPDIPRKKKGVDAETQVEKRGRGRPKKTPIETEPKEKRPRGRPKKKKDEV
jgi:hypothetical protein